MRDTRVRYALNTFLKLLAIARQKYYMNWPVFYILRIMNEMILVPSKYQNAFLCKLFPLKCNSLRRKIFNSAFAGSYITHAFSLRNLSTGGCDLPSTHEKN